MSTLDELHDPEFTADELDCQRFGHEYDDDGCVHCGVPFVWAVCAECAAGDHSGHRAHLGGICLGCPCSVTS